MLIQLAKGSIVEPKVNIDTRPVLGRMISVVSGHSDCPVDYQLIRKQLLRYLRPQYVPYYSRAVQLIWDLEGCTTHRHIEALIAETLTTRSGIPIYDAYEAFGVLWRMSGQYIPGCTKVGSDVI